MEPKTGSAAASKRRRGFFESKDAAALGDILAANSVQGADLLKLTAESLQEGLRFNSFGAMKVCKLRDSFLQLR